ncbi:MAG TPA: hypothetical protein VMZ03_10555, partial [Chitinophagaceae bacterium]|nr:hypothetical protein [Chitinophagaceae bacterium]
MKKTLLIATIIAIFISCKSKTASETATGGKADLLVYNATIYTVDSSFSIAEAMVISDGKIMATGKTTDLEKAWEVKE